MAIFPSSLFSCLIVVAIAARGVASFPHPRFSKLPPFPNLQWEHHTIVQPVDHFNFENTDTFSQRVFVSQQWYKGPGHGVIYYVGTEGSLDDLFPACLWPCMMAIELGALLVAGEHRYFGESLPYGNESWTPAHIGYLNIDQVLADQARAVAFIISQYFCRAGHRHRRQLWRCCYGVAPTQVPFGGQRSDWFRGSCQRHHE